MFENSSVVAHALVKKMTVCSKITKYSLRQNNRRYFA